ncbi:hypothetical protein O988_09651 [Pseudogymnoascus sp. VKM F-3808]|nr:hypothetical protein O988_09651 [Pseudogymnoascus sp. VKM F-3808]
MGRRKANGTGWSKKKSCLVWQVEWVAGSSDISTAAAPTIPGMLGPLGKILATTPLGEGYAAFVEEERRKAMTPEERAGEKKRRAGEVAEREGKRVKTSPGADGTSTTVEGQAQTDTDSAATPQDQQTSTTTSPAPAPTPQQTKSDYAFYLHRPLTRSSGPTVLIPLRAEEGLDTQLGGKVVLEFPRVYVFPAGASIPDNFEVEGGENEEGGKGGEEDESEEEEVVSDTSSSGSSSEEESSEEESESEDEDEDAGVEGGVAEEVTGAVETDAKAEVAGEDVAMPS